MHGGDLIDIDCESDAFRLISAGSHHSGQAFAGMTGDSNGWGVASDMKSEGHRSGVGNGVVHPDRQRLVSNGNDGWGGEAFNNNNNTNNDGWGGDAMDDAASNRAKTEDMISEAPTLESNYEVEVCCPEIAENQVKLADIQANKDSPLYSVKSFEELPL
jgi:hypothetical protein